MKLVVAYVQPFALEKVLQALHLTAGVTGATVLHGRGFGRGRAQSDEEQIVGTSPRVRVEVCARDEQVQGIVENILNAAHTGNRGDGKVLVLPIDSATRIQTRDVER